LIKPFAARPVYTSDVNKYSSKVKISFVAFDAELKVKKIFTVTVLPANFSQY
jgi:hypothetical protein